MIQLTSVRKGRIGELLVVNDLLRKGYDVYTPVIDDNGIDLIVMNGNLIKKVQCKSPDSAIGKYQTSIEVNTRGCGRSDVIAVPLKQKNCICYIPSLGVNRAKNIAFEHCSNKQKKNRNWYEDFLEIDW